MRIVLTHVYAWPEVRRGGERYLHELAAALQARGHTVTIITTAPRRSVDRILGVEVVRLRRRRWRPGRYGALAPEVAFGVQALVAVLRRRPDVWHAFGTSDAAAAAVLSKLRGPRSVYTDLGIPARSYRSGRPDRRIHQVVVRWVDHYLCLSAYAARYLEEGFGRVGVVQGGGVDVDELRPSGARADQPTLAYSGSLDEPRKNLPLLLEALALLAEERPEVQLWVSGPGDGEATLAAAPAAARARTTLLPIGDPSELGQLYGRAWATVLPSEREAFGLVVLESLACGTPVVALDEGGPSELITPATGVLSTADARQLAAACGAALDLARRPGTEAACRAAAEAQSWRDGIAPALEALYQQGGH